MLVTHSPMTSREMQSLRAPSLGWTGERLLAERQDLHAARALVNVSTRPPLRFSRNQLTSPSAFSLIAKCMNISEVQKYMKKREEIPLPSAKDYSHPAIFLRLLVSGAATLLRMLLRMEPSSSRGRSAPSLPRSP